jgi:hypothetical protein
MGFRQGSGGDNGNMSTGVLSTNAELWGTPTQTGAYNIVATVTDANGISTTQNLALNISPLWVEYSFARGTYEVPYSSTLRILGGSASYTSQVVPNTGLPAARLAVPTPASNWPPRMTVRYAARRGTMWVTFPTD